MIHRTLLRIAPIVIVAVIALVATACGSAPRETTVVQTIPGIDAVAVEGKRVALAWLEHRADSTSDSIRVAGLSPGDTCEQSDGATLTLVEITGGYAIIDRTSTDSHGALSQQRLAVKPYRQLPPEVEETKRGIER